LSDRLRFDFSHFDRLREPLRQIEQLVNQHILANAKVGMAEMDIDAAKAKGAMALFGEKYGDVVRVVDMGEFFQSSCVVERT